MFYKSAELHNVAELIAAEEGAGDLPVRIPDALRMKLNQNARDNAIQSAGCEVRFNLSSESAEVILVARVPNAWHVTCPVAEVYQGCFQTGWQAIGPEPTVVEVVKPAQQDRLRQLSREHEMPFDADLTRVVLPYRPPVRLMDVQGEVTPPRPEQVPDETCLAYGSSITHGHASVRPTGTWAMQTASKLGVDLVNLGFGGGAHLEPEMADYIAEREGWDFASLELGINRLSEWSSRRFTERVDYFVERIASAHPEKWIFCIDMFTFLHEELMECEQKKEFRRIVREKIDALNMPRVVHVDGTQLLPEATGLTSDLVHPSPAGMDTISDNLSRIIDEFLSTS